MEFLMETAEAGEDLFGQFRLELGIEAATEKDATGGGSELTQGAFVIPLKRTAALFKGSSRIVRERVLMGEVKDFQSGDIESVAVIGKMAALAAVGTGGISSSQMFVEIVIYLCN